MALTSVVSPTGRPEIDALIYGTRWASGNVTYGFASGAGDYGAGYVGGYTAGAQALGGIQQAAFRSALGEWSSVANLNFSETAASAATIRVAVTPQTSTALAFMPSTGEEGGDVWLGTGVAAESPISGSYAYHTYLHEIGHAIGLIHPHEAAVNPGITDQMAYSVMSYRSYPNAPLTGYTVAEGSYATSPMLSDIAAIQAIYGANYASHAGADTYRWTPGTIVFETVWDGGGTDTYDLSAFSTNLAVDLSPGGWTSFGTGLANLGDGQTPPGNVANAWTFNGDMRSLIENAIGGAGNDVMRGNVGMNDIAGGAGADTLYGAGGSDLLRGGAGNDVLYGGSGYSDPSDSSDIILGEAGDDLIYGNAGDDRIDAGQGSATVYGGYGLDTISAEITAGSRVYLFGGGASNDPTDVADALSVTGDGSNGLVQLLGNGGNDTLTATLVGNVRTEIFGGYGDDVIRLISQNAGTTTFIAGGPGSEDIAVAVNGWGTIFGGQSPADPTDGADRIDASGSNGRLEIYGNGGNDTILGGSNADTIHGGGGDDVIAGGGGADFLFGEGGADTFRIARGESAAGSMDEVIGFEAGDRLDLDVAGLGSRFTEVVNGAITNAAQALGAAAGAFAAGVVYVAVKGAADTFLFADYNGDKAGEWGVKLTGFTGTLDPATAIV